MASVSCKHTESGKSVTFNTDGLEGNLQELIKKHGEEIVKELFLAQARVVYQRVARNYLSDHTPEETVEFMKNWKLGDKAPSAKLSDEEKAKRAIDKMDDAGKKKLFELLAAKLKNQ